MGHFVTKVIFITEIYENFFLLWHLWSPGYEKMMTLSVNSEWPSHDLSIKVTLPKFCSLFIFLTYARASTDLRVNFVQYVLLYCYCTVTVLLLYILYCNYGIVCFTLQDCSRILNTRTCFAGSSSLIITGIILQIMQITVQYNNLLFKNKNMYLYSTSVSNCSSYSWSRHYR
jgi:hypothetical protein